MNLRDYIRILARRWLISALMGVVAVVIYLIARPIDPTTWTARTKVQIDTPEAILIAERSSSRLLPHPITVSTWEELIREQGIRNRVTEMLEAREKSGKLDTERAALISGYIGSIQTRRLNDTYLISLTARGPDEPSAVWLVNAYAEAAEAYSTDQSNSHIASAKKKAEEILGQKQTIINNLKEKLKSKCKDTNLEIIGAETLPEAASRLTQEYQTTASRLQEIDHTVKANDRRIGLLRERRAEMKALDLQAVPRRERINEMLARANKEVQGARNEITSLRKELFSARRRYTPTHPKVIELEEAIREREVGLTELSIDAMQGDIDREIVGLITRNQLMGTEKSLLEEHREVVRAKLNNHEKPLEEYQRLEDALTREVMERDKYAGFIGHIGTFPDMPGYIRTLEGQRAKTGAVIPTDWQQYYLFAIVIFAVFFALCAFSFDQFDSCLRTDYDIKRHLNLKVLTIVPRVKKRGDQLLLHAASKSGIAEEFDKLLTLVTNHPGEEQIRTLTIVSPSPKEGKSSASINTAIAAARQGKRVLLVDADLRIPTIHQMWGLPNDIGFSNMLAQNLSETEAEQIYKPTSIPNLSVITSGPHPENPYELMEIGNIRPVMEQLGELFDLVVFDTPPLLHTGDAIKLAGVTDASIMVVGADETDHRRATWAKHLMENINIRILGVILNKAGHESGRYYYYYDSEYRSVRA